MVSQVPCLMISQGYNESDIDQCLYTEKARDGSVMILILYINDMFIARTHSHEITTLKSKVNAHFYMKDLGEASHTLGMCIT